MATINCTVAGFGSLKARRNQYHLSHSDITLDNPSCGESHRQKIFSDSLDSEKMQDAHHGKRKRLLLLFHSRLYNYLLLTMST